MNEGSSERRHRNTIDLTNLVIHVDDFGNLTQDEEERLKLDSENNIEDPEPVEEEDSEIEGGLHTRTRGRVIT